MKQIILFLCLIMVTTLLSADIAPDTLWTRTFGGRDNDYAQSVQQTSDGGYVIVGYTNSSGPGDQNAWIFKIDENGTEEWNKALGGSQNDYGMSIQQTSDGGYIIAGYTNSFGAGLLDFWLIKTDENGTEEWNKALGGSQNDYAQAVQQTSDGGYIIVGYTESYGAGECDIWLIKTNSTGTEEWNKIFGDVSNDRAYSVRQASDGGYIIAGATTHGGDSDIWLIKTNSAGTEEWNKTFGKALFEEAFSVQQTLDGGYIVAGYSGPFNNLDAMLIKTDSMGNDEWINTFGGSDAELAESVQQTAAGGYVMAGLTQSYGSGLFDFWIVKAGSDGTEEWSKDMGGANNDMATSIQQTSDGGYIVTGSTSSYGLGGTDYWLIKLESDCPNEEAGIRFDLDAKTYGNQNLTEVLSPTVGEYLRVDCYAINAHNLDTYQFEILYDSKTLKYVGSSATNPLTYEENILTKNGGTAIGWMVNETPGVLSIAYTLAGDDTTQAPEGEGLIADVVFQVLKEIGDTLRFGETKYYDTFGEVDIITDKDEAIIKELISVDEEEIHFEESMLSHYPNPVQNRAMIKYGIKDMLRSETVDISIYNAKGQLVDMIEGKNGIAIWDTNKHPNGIYFYKINTDSYTEVKKMMVTK